MDVMRFGYRYWRRNMPMAVFAQILSFIALLAELFIPIVQEMLVDYVIFESDKPFLVSSFSDTAI